MELEFPYFPVFHAIPLCLNCTALVTISPQVSVPSPLPTNSACRQQHPLVGSFDYKGEGCMNTKQNVAGGPRPARLRPALRARRRSSPESGGAQTPGSGPPVRTASLSGRRSPRHRRRSSCATWRRTGSTRRTRGWGPGVRMAERWQR